MASLYTRYLSDAFDLERSEEFFELPLDSVTGTELNKRAAAGNLPRWSGVKHLTPDVSAAFQREASKQATHNGIARVHLDALWWGGRTL